MALFVSRRVGATMLGVSAAFLPSAAWATDIYNVLPAAMDQPQINAFIRLPGAVDPLQVDFGTGASFNITAFYDTGASGVLLSTQTASFLSPAGTDSGVPLEYANGSPVVFSDVGVAGTDDFHVTVPLEIGLAPFSQLNNELTDDLSTFESVYTTRFQNVRAHVGPVGVVVENPILEGLDVFGMPTMAGKKIVMDSRAINDLVGQAITGTGAGSDDYSMRTYAYDPATPFRPETVNTDPGVPVTERHVQMSYASFDRFTKTNPVDAPTPTLRNNPFFGPNPVEKMLDEDFDDGTPAIKVGFNGQTTEATFLFDTGAAASIISTAVAERIGIRYVADTYGTDAPQLEVIGGGDIGETFTLGIGGIGGTTTLVGFYLDEMLLRTIEGGSNDLDEAHLRFVGAPVLVGDITLFDELTQKSLTLDGIFGMNFLTASADITTGASDPTSIFNALSVGAFDWAVFDEPNGVLGLTMATVPEPTLIAPALLVLSLGLSRYNRRQRCR